MSQLPVHAEPACSWAVISIFFFFCTKVSYQRERRKGRYILDILLFCISEFAPLLPCLV
jgi:hypothetical protein